MGNQECSLDKLDRLSAELIMGWNLCTGGEESEWEEEFMWLEKDGRPTFYYLGTDEVGSDEPWQPTRNIAQAWELLDKALPEITIQYRDGWHVSINSTYFLDCQNVPLAIVKACLTAKGVEV